MVDQLNPETAAHYLRDIRPKWKGYWLHMHLVAFSLPEFADGLGRISDEVFLYHVSGQKNDFAKWISEVVGDSDLAHKMETVQTKEEAAKLVQARVEDLRRFAAPIQMKP